MAFEETFAASVRLPDNFMSCARCSVKQKSTTRLRIRQTGLLSVCFIYESRSLKHSFLWGLRAAQNLGDHVVGIAPNFV